MGTNFIAGLLKGFSGQYLSKKQRDYEEDLNKTQAQLRMLQTAYGAAAQRGDTDTANHVLALMSEFEGAGKGKSGKQQRESIFQQFQTQQKEGRPSGFSEAPLEAAPRPEEVTNLAPSPQLEGYGSIGGEAINQERPRTVTSSTPIQPRTIMAPAEKGQIGSRETIRPFFTPQSELDEQEIRSEIGKRVGIKEAMRPYEKEDFDRELEKLKAIEGLKIEGRIKLAERSAEAKATGNLRALEAIGNELGIPDARGWAAQQLMEDIKIKRDRILSTISRAEALTRQTDEKIKQSWSRIAQADIRNNLSAKGSILEGKRAELAAISSQINQQESIIANPNADETNRQEAINQVKTLKGRAEYLYSEIEGIGRDVDSIVNSSTGGIGGIGSSQGNQSGKIGGKTQTPKVITTQFYQNWVKNEGGDEAAKQRVDAYMKSNGMTIKN